MWPFFLWGVAARGAGRTGAASRKGFRMSEFITLNKNKDFHRLYNRGRSYVSPVLVTYVMKNRIGDKRLGITTSKKVGKAVKRNRARRVILQAYREMFPSVKNGYDFVFVARGKTPYVKSTDIRRAMAIHMKKAGVLK